MGKHNIGNTRFIRRQILGCPVIFIALMMLGFISEAADITWSTATISGEERDVCTFWNLDRAYNLGATKTKTNILVNGVNFKPLGNGAKFGIGPAKLAATNTLLAVSGDEDGINSVDGKFGVGLTNLSTDYQSLLQSAVWDNGSVWALILNGLTVSNTYLVQLWVNDSRGTNFTETLTGGTNTSSPVHFNTSGQPGGLGQQIMGMFVADNSSQVITFNPNDGPAQLNAFQLRVTAGNSPPVIIKSPVSLAKQTGAKVSLSVLAWGQPPLTYQWQKISTNNPNGLASASTIAGATNNVLSLASLAATNAGDYRVVITNLSGLVTSAVASISLIPSFQWIWTGNVNGTWDTAGTANWSTNGVATTYTDGIEVRFDDTASMTSVTNAVTVFPYAIVVANNTNNYTFSGSPIAGNIGLVKNGTGILTLTSTNTYNGGTVIKSGTVSISADYQDGTGALTFGGGILDITGSHAFLSGKNIILNTNGGTVQVDNTAGATLSGRISGNGGLTKTGTGTLILSGTNNAYAGGTIVNNGKLLATTGGWYAHRSIGSGMLTINNGATVEFTKPHGFGVDLSGKSVTINGGKLRLDGDNYVSGITMSGGSITVTNGHYLALCSNMVCKVNAVESTATIKADAVKLMGAVVFDIARGSAPVDFNIIGGCTNIGSLVKTGDGIMVLAGANKYAGPTTIRNGTLQVNGSIGTSTVTVSDGATLRGKGIIGGETTVQNGGTLAPGTSDIGTLTINNSLALNGNVTFRISKNGSTLANDQISGLTGVTYGGTLTLTNITSDATPIIAGDAFTIFNAATHDLTFASVNLPALPAGLSWDTNSLATSGVIKVTNGKAP